MTTQLDRIEGKVDDIHTTLRGPPDDPGKGVVVRVDRLEQRSKRWGFVTNTLLGAFLVTGATAVWSWVKFGGRAG